MSAILCPVSLQTIFRDGRPMVGAKILIYEAGTTTPKTVYQDAIMQAAHPRPILTDAQGMVPPIYIGKGDYKLRILTSGNIIISEVDGLPGSATASDIPDPGETYPLTDPTAVLVTGDIIAAFRTGSKAGFARCNGNTIGSSLSAASEVPFGEPSNQAQPMGSAFKLFVHLWELQEIGLELPVYANGVEVQRGSTAISDWDSNRQLGLPDLRGRALVGLDGMGAPVSNRLQFSRELTTTKGSVDAHVSDIAGIIAGMAISGTGVMKDTIIKAIDGLKLTLSLPASSTTSATARFSQFGNANIIGSTGGEQSYALTTGQLPPHAHDASSRSDGAGGHAHSGRTDVQGGHSHSYTSPTGPGAEKVGAMGFIAMETRQTGWAGEHAHNVAIDGVGNHIHAIHTDIAKTGAGQSYAAMPPAILTSYYIKL